MKNIFLRKDSTYTRMVEKCAQELYGKEPEQDNCTFYIADSKGIEVWSSDDIKVDVEGSGENQESCNWSLEKYIKLSGIKYPSKARFFCVKKTVQGKIY